MTRHIATRHSATRHSATREIAATTALRLAKRAVAYAVLCFAVSTIRTGVAAAQPAPRVTATLPAAELSALEAIRKDVWVRWFAGDTAALRRALGPELVAISPDGQQTLTETLAGSSQFKSGGGRLVSIAFDKTSIHRVGEVVVMFSHYTLVTEQARKQITQKGRATEVFVRQNGRWVHTSWHLDAAG